MQNTDLIKDHYPKFTMNFLSSKGLLPDTHRSQYYVTGFSEKKKLYCKVSLKGDWGLSNLSSQSRIQGEI